MVVVVLVVVLVVRVDEEEEMKEEMEHDQSEPQRDGVDAARNLWDPRRHHFRWTLVLVRH